MMAIHRTSPRKPTIREPIAIAAGATTNLKSIPNAVKVAPQSIIFGCNAINSPESMSKFRTFFRIFLLQVCECIEKKVL